MSNRKTLNFEDVVVKNKSKLCEMIYEFLTFLWDYALKKPDYFLVSFQDGPPDQTFFDAFSTAFRLSKSYHFFLEYLTQRLLTSLPEKSHLEIADLSARHIKDNSGYFFLKLLRLYHRNELYKGVHGAYLLEDLVLFHSDEFNERPLILQLISFLSRAIPKFHRGLDIGEEGGRRHTRLEDRIHTRFLSMLMETSSMTLLKAFAASSCYLSTYWLI